MKKRFLTLVLIAAMGLSITACGNSSTDTKEDGKETKKETTKKEEPEEPTDLTGTWASEDVDGNYQEATITEDYIEINWISDGEPSLYWAGTFTAPDKAVDEYSWTSENDKEKTNTALLASGDDTKEFSYKDGTISYEVSALGTTSTYVLSKK